MEEGMFIVDSVSFNKAAHDMKEAHFLDCSCSSIISPPPSFAPFGLFPVHVFQQTLDQGLSHDVGKVRWISVWMVGRRHCR